MLKSIEALPPGLYGMQIHERKGRDGKVEYEVEFDERRLEDIVKRLNRFERADEKPFEAVAALSEFNQRAYELFAQPFVQSMGNEVTAKLSRQFHPLRFQRWAFSDLNPWLAWLGPGGAGGQGAAPAGRRRQPRPRKVEKMLSEAISASLDYYREIRDATSEAAFFQTYGNVFSLYLADKHEADERRRRAHGRAARAAVRQGGAGVDRARAAIAEALARVASLLARRGEPLPLARLALKQELAAEYRDLLPRLRARPVAAHPRRAGHHRPLRAREGDRDAAQAAVEARRSRAAGDAGPRGCSPTSACSASSRRPSSSR